MSKRELWSGLKKLRFPLRGDDVENLFRYIDTDGSGEIGMPEFFAFACPPMGDTPSLPDKLYEHFRSVRQQNPDIDFVEVFANHGGTESGTISYQSFQHALTSLGFQFYVVRSRGSRSLQLGGDKDRSRFGMYRMAMLYLTTSSEFAILVNLLILANTVTMAFERAGMSVQARDTLQQANMVFTVAFTVEMAFKLFALGFRGYVRDR